ncbi:hypothetical protein B7463_g3988, partial [Scytalidium lignicola]
MLFLSRRPSRDPVLYEPLNEEKNDGDAHPYAREPSSRRGNFWDLRFDFWALLACIFASITVVLLGVLYRQHILLTRGPSYEHGFATELATSRSTVELVDIHFTGELAVENGQWIRRVNNSNIQYTGPPSDAIDKAWANLIQPINIDLEEDEAEGIQDTLNIVRMAVYRDYYLFPDDPSKREFTWIHLDFVRQAVQCHADMTPMKWFWSDTRKEAVLKPEAPHTCRKWDNIQQWAMDRIHVLTEVEKAKIQPRPTHGTWIP